jgi:hypothetical protein
MNRKIRATLLIGGIPFLIILSLSLWVLIGSYTAPPEGGCGIGALGVLVLGVLGLEISFILLWAVVFLCAFFTGKIHVPTPVWMFFTFLPTLLFLAFNGQIFFFHS